MDQIDCVTILKDIQKEIKTAEKLQDYYRLSKHQLRTQSSEEGESVNQSQHVQIPPATCALDLSLIYSTAAATATTAEVSKNLPPSETSSSFGEEDSNDNEESGGVDNEDSGIPDNLDIASVYNEDSGSEEEEYSHWDFKVLKSIYI